MLGPCGEVVLLDWGLVRLEGEVSPDDDEVLGTLAYMSPDQIKGDVGAQSDVYMLCATLYELFSLHHYLGLQTEDVAEVGAAVLRREPLPADTHVHGLNGRVPRDLARLCEEGLAKDPAERTRSVAEVEAALQLYLERMSPVMCPTTFSLRMLSGWQGLLVRYPGPATALTLLGLGLFPLALICLAAVLLGAV
jgi:serine/threonine protein kinase